MLDDLEDDYEPEHDQLLDSGAELEEMFGDELQDDDAPQQASVSCMEEDPADEYQSGLDDDW